MADKSSSGKTGRIVVKSRPYREATGSPRKVSTDDKTFRRFIESLPVMFYAVEPKPPHKPIYISPAFQTFSYPMAEWMSDGDIWDRVIHPEDRDSVIDTTRDAMRNGEDVDL